LGVVSAPPSTASPPFQRRFRGASAAATGTSAAEPRGPAESADAASTGSAVTSADGAAPDGVESWTGAETSLDPRETRGARGDLVADDESEDDESGDADPALDDESDEPVDPPDPRVSA
jgi:hypothetical protein